VNHVENNHYAKIISKHHKYTVHVLSAKTDEISLKKARRLGQDFPYPRAYDVNHKHGVLLRGARRAISPLSFVNSIYESCLKDILHQPNGLDTLRMHLHRARAQRIVLRLVDSSLNVVEDADGGLVISNMKCDHIDLLSSLLHGSAVAEGNGGRWAHEAEAFDDTVL
jgi:hypothetical protein